MCPIRRANFQGKPLTLIDELRWDLDKGGGSESVNLDFYSHYPLYKPYTVVTMWPFVLANPSNINRILARYGRITKQCQPL